MELSFKYIVAFNRNASSFTCLSLLCDSHIYYELFLLLLIPNTALYKIVRFIDESCKAYISDLVVPMAPTNIKFG